jgi:hypothetical protein
MITSHGVERDTDLLRHRSTLGAGAGFLRAQRPIGP